MKDLFKIGDLVRDTSLKPDKNRGYGVVLDILPGSIRKDQFNKMRLV